jgi:DNA-directed RNA polymerase sigma subunit (sigma70/sigma32)
MGSAPDPESEAMAKRKSEVKRVFVDHRKTRFDYLAPRNQAILARRAQGATLERIGDEFGLSGEQIRQILIKAERKAKEGKRPGR